jgi:PII-like signaling protein
MTEDAILVRINLQESDHGKRKNLIDEILHTLRDRLSLDNVSVLRGIAGLGARGIVHASDMMHFDVDLPLIVEFCCAPTLAEAAIALLVALVPDGHVVSFPVTRYRRG